MNEEEIFNNIKSRIDLLNQQVYSEYSIEKIKRKKIKTIKTPTYEPDIALLNHRLSKQKQIGKITVDNLKKHETTSLNINEEVSDEKLIQETKPELIAWKNLEIDTKITKFEEYMTKTAYVNFPEVLHKKLITMIQEGKLDKKKYINYNEEYSRIYDMPIINYDANIQEYYLRSDRENKKKKISKIFK